MRKLLVTLFLLCGARAWATTPTITTVTGTVSQGSTVTIAGLNYDARPEGNNKPIIYWNGETGGIACDLSISSNTFSGTEATLIDTTTSHRRVSTIPNMVSESSWSASSNPHFGDFTQYFNVAGSTPHGVPAFGKKFYKAMYRKMDYTIGTGALDKNIKIDRDFAYTVFLATGRQRYPNRYDGHAINTSSTAWITYVEDDVPFVTGSNHKIDTFSLHNTYKYHEHIMKMSSANDASDGYFMWAVDNSTIALLSTFLVSDSDTAPGTPAGQFIFQDQFSNQTSTQVNGVAYRSTMVLDYGWGRAILGNASTWAACTHLEYQPYFAWSTSLLSLRINAGEFTPGTHVWLYVFNDSNEVSQGQELIIGQTYPVAGTVSVIFSGTIR